MSIQYPEQLEYYLNFARKHVDEEDAMAVLATLADHIGEDNQTTLETLALVAYGSIRARSARHGMCWSLRTERRKWDCFRRLYDRLNYVR